MSLLVALFLLIIKFACFSDTYAPPTFLPFRLSFVSINAPALIVSGFLNTLPALGYSKGCVCILFCVYSFILSSIMFLSSCDSSIVILKIIAFLLSLK